jgi:hypothetical protein
MILECRRLSFANELEGRDPEAPGLGGVMEVPHRVGWPSVYTPAPKHNAARGFLMRTGIFVRARLVQVQRMGCQRCSMRQVEDGVQETPSIRSQQHKGGSSDHVLTTSTFPSCFVSTRPTLQPWRSVILGTRRLGQPSRPSNIHSASPSPSSLTRISVTAVSWRESIPPSPPFGSRLVSLSGSRANYRVG